jgi:hypothetical protein
MIKGALAVRVRDRHVNMSHYVPATLTPGEVVMLSRWRVDLISAPPETTSVINEKASRFRVW